MTKDLNHKLVKVTKEVKDTPIEIKYDTIYKIEIIETPDKILVKKTPYSVALGFERITKTFHDGVQTTRERRESR